MNLYQTLGVRDGANPAEILWAFKSLSEANQEADFDTQLALGEAFQTLMNPELRAQYDASLNQVPVHTAVHTQNYHYTENNYQVCEPTHRPSSISSVIVWFAGAYVCLSLILLIIVAI